MTSFKITLPIVSFVMLLIGIPFSAHASLLIDPAASNGELQIVTAQTALSNIGAGTVLAPTMTTTSTLTSGIYNAASFTTTAGTTLYLDGQNLDNQFWVFNITDILSMGANTTIEMINMGINPGIIWNVGGYASLGASSTFIGTILAYTYVSIGASTNVADVNNLCGGLYSATSYVSMGASSVIGGSGCSKAPNSFRIDPNGNAYYQVVDVAEPGSLLVMLMGLVFTGLLLPRWTRRGKVAP